MSAEPEPQSAASQLVDRVRTLLLKPEAGWEAIAGERTTLRALFVGYVAPLAAIPAVAGLVGRLMFGQSSLGVTFRPNPVSAAAETLIQYALTFAMVYLIALVVDFLAEYFDARRDRDQAMKLAVYAPTPMWIAGVFALYPPIGLLAAIAGAAYSAFLLFRGIPPLMKTSEEKALGYAAAVTGAGLVLGVVTFALSNCALTVF